ncbi:MAG: 16S rRNA (guanine(527)-N(7))-methyltransferase RsmG [Candidatus Peribacteraceae bacterium]|nr:16S rRNA (guanine(527)-N(7))-methyltransferase RsmG [Candidatus Peribacteraceae bacterium]
MSHDEDRERLLHELVKVFLEENSKVNLSAFRTEESCWVGNILDSLSFLELLPLFSTLNSQLSILDIGTGGGFPLLPLMIALPDVRFTGIDSTQKKIDAVARVITSLGFARKAPLDLLCGRVEEFGHHFREEFDVVTARAVAEINVLLEYAAPFLKIGGKIILWKSMDIEQELKESQRAQKEFHCPLKDRHVYELPGDFGKRQLLIFEKTGKTPPDYPRPVGMAKKKPI